MKGSGNQPWGSSSSSAAQGSTPDRIAFALKGQRNQIGRNGMIMRLAFSMRNCGVEWFLCPFRAQSTMIDLDLGRRSKTSLPQADILCPLGAKTDDSKRRSCCDRFCATTLFVMNSPFHQVSPRPVIAYLYGDLNERMEVFEL